MTFLNNFTDCFLSESFEVYSDQIAETCQSWTSLTTEQLGRRVSSTVYSDTLVRCPDRNEIYRVDGKRYRQLSALEQGKAQFFLRAALRVASPVFFESRAVNPSLRRVYSPSTKTLALQCLHYEEKYGIRMMVTTTSDIDVVLNSPLCRHENFFGVILEDIKVQNGHVSPFIFYRKTYSDPWMIISLDSIGGRIHPESGGKRFVNFIGKALGHPSIGSVIASETTRQNDLDSCRTDALVILRNFLLYLQKEGDDFDPFIVLSPKPSELEGLDDYYVFDQLPEAVVHTSQTWKEADQPEAALLHNPVKSMADFKHRFVHPILIQEKISIPAANCVITARRFSERNIYLIYKGAKVVKDAQAHSQRYHPALVGSRILRK